MWTLFYLCSVWVFSCQYCNWFQFFVLELCTSSTTFWKCSIKVSWCWYKWFNWFQFLGIRVMHRQHYFLELHHQIILIFKYFFKKFLCFIGWLYFLVIMFFGIRAAVLNFPFCVPVSSPTLSANATETLISSLPLD